MYRVIVIGGGWSGCAAALAAKKAGADVTLLEKTDLLLGLGNVGGIMRNNGRFTATEEHIAMGASELFAITDRLSRHRNIDFPGHAHASLYDVLHVEPAVRRFLQEKGIGLRMQTRIVDVEMSGSAACAAGDSAPVFGRRIAMSVPANAAVPAASGMAALTSVGTAAAGSPQDGTTDSKPAAVKYISRLIAADGEIFEGDAFVECTGSTGPMGNCLAYGNGCCMCILRCPAFGPRVSITQKAGKNDIMGFRRDGSFGAFSGSGKLEKASLSQEICQQLDEKGVAVLPLPQEKISREKLDLKVCQQYALAEYADNIILLDTGYAKIMTPFIPLEQLRTIPGLEDARYADPYAGGKGNSIRYLSVAERDDAMRVPGIDNLLCAGEKSGLFVGHTEAITTGTLAGYNTMRILRGIRPLVLPEELALGDLLAYANRKLETREGLMTRYTFAGAEYFQRMKEKGLYSTDPQIIAKRVKRLDLDGIYN